jgi:hypothetical protein
LNARGFRFARAPVRMNGIWEPMRGNRKRLLGFAERFSVRRGRGRLSIGAVELGLKDAGTELDFEDAARAGGWHGGILTRAPSSADLGLTPQAE